MATPTSTAISERLQGEAVLLIESTVPAELTLDEWRRLRPRTPRRRLRRVRSHTPRAARHLTLVPESPCELDPPLLAA
jgi:hypothetical protein